MAGVACEFRRLRLELAASSPARRPGQLRFDRLIGFSTDFGGSALSVVLAVRLPVMSRIWAGEREVEYGARCNPLGLKALKK
jgi:hypothetical protein